VLLDIPSARTNLTPPYIIKAVWEHASFGMGDDAVVLDEESRSVQDRLHEWSARWGRPCFAELYVEGREFNLSVLASPLTLPSPPSDGGEGRVRGGRRLQRYQDVQTLEDHPAFLSLPERRGEFEFLWSRSERARLHDLPNPSAGDVERDLETCVRALSERGHRVVYADLTTPDVAPFGIHVVRTLATGLQPIHFGWGQERLGGRRLFELPHQLGLAPGPHSEADLNPCPHPLA
jgi:YcaO cyclodehydratase, ATP-ad Mg2+-binding